MRMLHNVEIEYVRIPDQQKQQPRSVLGFIGFV